MLRCRTTSRSTVCTPGHKSIVNKPVKIPSNHNEKAGGELLTDLTDAAPPAGETVADEAVTKVCAGAAVLAGVGVTVRGGGGTRAALPSVLTHAGEIPVAVPAGCVVAARTISTLVNVWRGHNTAQLAAWRSGP